MDTFRNAARSNRRTPWFLLALALAVGCPVDDDDPGDDDAQDDDTGDDDAAADADGDGAIEGIDCDDQDPTSYPGAPELCDGMDNDCDGQLPDDEADGDMDGVMGCEGDCDDGDPTAFPGGTEVCDGDDEDCDGAVDNGFDVDGDGNTVCGPDGIPGNADDDCDDGDPDRDALDVDGDSFTSCDDDCDDDDADVHPGAQEICDGKDSNCDGFTPNNETDHDGDGDVGCADCNDDADWLNHADADGDGSSTCDGDCDDADPAMNLDDVDADGWSTCWGDCDDSDPALDPADDDGDGYSTCDGDCDDGDATLSPADLDGDGSSTCDGDCDDGNGQSHPGATEICDGGDNDCNGFIPFDENDVDLDGSLVCEGDCDDFDATVHPGAEPLCDGIADNDCDGIDDPEELDQDGDGATPCDGDCDDGDPSLNTHDLDVDGYTTCDGDCEDGNDAVNPGIAEVCNDGVDNDCDGGPGECGVFGEWSLDDADAIIRGTSWSYLTGERGLAQGIDLDGDGVGEIFAGAHGDNEAGSSAGAAYLWAGPFSGELDTTDAVAKLLGEAPGDSAGYACAAGGDADGDGSPDLLIGAIGHDDAVIDGGATYVITSVPSGTLSLGLAEAKIVGAVEEDRSGVDVEFAGDVNGDGYDDLLIGVLNHDVGNTLEAGAAALIDGPVAGEISLASPDALLVGQGTNSHAGRAVAPAGDVNGDGYDDVLVGAANWTWSGKAYLLYGPLSGTIDLGQADESWSGISWPEYSDVSDPQGVFGAGDIDADGVDDFIVAESRWGEFGENYQGRAHLFLGPMAPSTSLDGADFHLIGADEQVECGSHVSGAGDVNGDGYGDLLVGCWMHDVTGGYLADQGAAVVVYGPVTGTLYAGDAPDQGHALLLGVDYYDEAGQVRPAGDLNGDGYDDVLVGSADAGPHQGGGSIYVWFGGEM